MSEIPRPENGSASGRKLRRIIPRPRKLARPVVAVTALVLLAANGATATIEVDLTNVRNGRGVLHLCLTRAPEHFPDCERDPAAARETVNADIRTVRLSGVEPGSYALSVIHDENANGRLDTTLGIPREGFGFSRNPAIGFGPPSFDKVLFAAESGASHQTVRLRYLL